MTRKHLRRHLPEIRTPESRGGKIVFWSIAILAALFLLHGMGVF
jgi:hypothetical protein